MKKKIIAIALLVAIVVCALLAFTACADITNDSYALQTEKKYIYEGCVNQDTSQSLRYYVFHKDGTAEYYRKSTEKHTTWDAATNDYVSVVYNYDYTIYYKYFFVDKDKSTIFYTYDHYENNSTDGKGNKLELSQSNAGNGMLMVSKNVVIATGSSYSYYINEDYIKQIPNFNLPTEDN